MIVVPIVISSLIVGIAGVGDATKLGRIGLKTIIYFEIITTVAIIVGMLLADTVQPGAGIELQQLTASDLSQYQQPTAEVQHGPHSLVSPILTLVPSNVYAAIRSEEHTSEHQSLI